MDNKISKVYDISISTDRGVIHIVPKENVSISMDWDFPSLNKDKPFRIKKTFTVEGDFEDLKIIT